MAQHKAFGERPNMKILPWLVFSLLLFGCTATTRSSTAPVGTFSEFLGPNIGYSLQLLPDNLYTLTYFCYADVPDPDGTIPGYSIKETGTWTYSSGTIYLEKSTRDTSHNSGAIAILERHRAFRLTHNAATSYLTSRAREETIKLELQQPNKSL